jgi:Ion channel
MAAVEPQGSLGDAYWQRYSERRFGILLLILLALLGGSPILVELGLSSRWYDGLMTLLMLAAILPLCFEPHQRLLALLLGVPTIIFSLGGFAFSGTVGAWAMFIGHFFEVLFFTCAAALIVRSLFNIRTMTVDSIFGAACGYLFLGLGWAVLYSMIEEFRPGSFAANLSLITSEDPPRVLPHVLTYYSFVTLTTVGYGDVTPISATTRTFAWIEAMSGQFYLAVVVAGLVSMIVANTSQPAPGRE